MRRQQREQAQAIERLLLHYALLRPQLNIRLDASALDNGRVWHRGSLNSHMDAVALQFGSRVRSDLSTLVVEHKDFKIECIVPKREPRALSVVMRSTNDRSFVGVNGRPVEVCRRFEFENTNQKLTSSFFVFHFGLFVHSKTVSCAGFNRYCRI